MGVIAYSTLGTLLAFALYGAGYLILTGTCMFAHFRFGRPVCRWHFPRANEPVRVGQHGYRPVYWSQRGWCCLGYFYNWIIDPGCWCTRATYHDQELD